jgi:hypothetical protein
VAGPTVVVRFLGDLTGLQKSSREVEAQGSKLKDFAVKAGGALAGAFAVEKLVTFAKEGVDAASNLSESVSKVGVVFGEAATGVEAWAKNAAESMGLSTQAALEAAATYGNLAVSLGIPGPQAADMSKSLVGLASDLASFNNVPVDQALDALRSGLTGETEPLKKFGVAINAAAIEQEALALGLKTGNQPLTAAAKAQATYALVMKQTTTAQGDFSRTSDGLANQQRILAARTENLKAAFGQVLLPVITSVVTALNNYLLPAFNALSSWISNNQTVLVAAFIGFGTVIAAVLVPSFIAWAASAGAAAIATLAAAAPFIAIGAVIAGVAYLIINNWDTIVAATKAAWDAVVGAIKAVFTWVKTNWPLLLAILTGPIGAAVLVIMRNWDTIKDGVTAVWQWVADKWSAIVGAISSAGGSIATLMGSIVGAIKLPIAAATEVYDWVKDKFGALAGFIEGVVGSISSAASSIANAIKAPINAVIRAWNGLSFTMPKVEIPDWVPGVGGKGFGGFTIDFPNLPTLAAGGVLTSPTLFVGGEAGTEVVAPEALLRRIVAEESGRGTYNLTIQTLRADPADVAWAFRRLELMAGAS